MITVTVEQKHGATTRQVKVSAPSIKRALEVCGSHHPDIEVRVVFPIDAETLFAPATPESIDYTSMSPEKIEGFQYPAYENALAQATSRPTTRPNRKERT